MVADDTVSNSCRQQTLDGTKYGDGDGRPHQALDGLPGQFRHYGTGQRRIDAETVANGLDAGHTGILLQQQHRDSHHNDGHQRAGQCLEG